MEPCVGFSNFTAPIQELPKLRCGLGSALGMILQVDIGLYGMNAADALPLARSLKHAVVIRNYQPKIRAAEFVPESESFQHFVRWVAGQVDRDDAKVGEARVGPCRGKSSYRVPYSFRDQIVADKSRETLAGLLRDVPLAGRVFGEAVFLSPSIQKQRRILRAQRRAFVSNHESFVQESCDDSAHEAFVHIGSTGELALSERLVGVS